MKRLVCILAAFIIVLTLPGNALGAPPDWTLVPIPGSDGSSSPVFFDTDSYLASDITLDINGNLYVMSGSRIIRFTPEGKVDTSWGKSGIIYDAEIENSNSEQMNIVADSRGYVYAECRICVDGSPTFIKRYTPEGEADKSWYGDSVMGGKVGEEDIVADDTETGDYGICYQDEIALDSKDNLYVLYDRQVYKFLPDGTPDKQWRKVKMVQPEKVYDDGGDGVWFSNAMRIDREDNVYLFNGNDRIVSKYSRTGRPLKSQNCALYYLYEEEESSHYFINQVAFDLDGNIYNINPDGNSISRYSPEYVLDAGWCGGALTVGKRSETIKTISNFEMDASGNFYIIDEENEVVSKYTNDGNIDKGWGSNGSVGNVNSDGEREFDIINIICGSDGYVYVIDQPDFGEAIIKKLGLDFALNEAWAPKLYSDGNWGIDEYSSMASHGEYLYVEQSNVDDAGASISRIIRIDREGKESTDWEISSNVDIEDIQIDSSGNIYTSNDNIYVTEDTITKYLPDGNVDESWGLKGSIEGAGSNAEMAVDSSGYLYISERNNNSITRYTPGGQIDRDWGEDGKAVIPAGAEDSRAYYTYFITLDSAGNLYLSDYINNRILRYNSSGQIDTTWCDGGEWKSFDNYSDELMPMIHPTHLMICDGRLYAIWNDKLYVMNDLIAQAGVKPPQAPEPAEPPAEEAVSTARTLSLGQWGVCIGGLVFCAGAILAIFLCLPKKNKRRMTKIKSIKIAKR